ncbi:CBU_0592 family membrane protein [Psychromonas ossibalaenae]|uniref:CBU_0592 family membrane protein n=1 Tax=Psychromonas ossibalaenae TaxID=444922 RepID=UPI00038092F5|nr:hypothetical protein [Psychromonas ossibalaenae]
MLDIQWYDVVGLLGSMIILGTYFALQMRKMSSSTTMYSLTNTAGAFLILVSLYFDFNLAAFVIEIFWFIISVGGLWKSKSPVEVNIT